VPASPSRFSAMSPTRMKPAWAIDEYASMRLTSVWVSPSTAPITMVRIATAHTTGRQSHLVVVNAT
jgi:hypothetical protein